MVDFDIGVPDMFDFDIGNPYKSVPDMFDFDIGSPYKSVPDMFDFFYKVVSVVYHSPDSTCVLPPLLRAHMTS